MKSVNIILCTYNSERTIKECIDSILGQTFKDFDLFIFDDCSQDNTVEKIRSYVYRDPRITLVRAKKNIGTYSAKNFIFKNFCKSKYVALHDSDDYSEKNRLQKQVEYMKLHDVACLGTAVREFWDEDIEPHTISDNQISNNERKNVYPQILRKRDSIKELASLSTHDFYKALLQFKFCMNGTVMFKKEVLDEIGGWDGNTRMGGDTDIFIRILGKYDIHNLQDCLYNRRFHNFSLTSSGEYGMKSDLRKEYAILRHEVVQKSASGTPEIRNIYYPRPFEYEVVKCVE